MNDHKIPKKMIIAWGNRSQHASGQQLTSKDNNIHAIQQVLPTMSKEAKLKEWTATAQDEALWSNYIVTQWSKTASAVIKLKDKFENGKKKIMKS